MSNNFIGNRKKHLQEYSYKKHLPVGGFFRKKGPYGHILDVDKSRVGLIEKYNLVSGLKFDFIPIKKIHMYANHLNSSQVLCYNFFRPMLNDDHTPKQELIDLLKRNGVTVSEKAKCDFEYDGYSDYKNEGTEFDFHILDGEVEIFFEIKYTEDGFGSAPKDKRHKNKYNETYLMMLKECQCLENKTLEMDDFFENYQLYRNVLRITNPQKYTVFITAKGNQKTYSQLNSFLCNIKKEYKKNVLALNWEDLIDENHILYEKYIAE